MRRRSSVGGTDASQKDGGCGARGDAREAEEMPAALAEESWSSASSPRRHLSSRLARYQLAGRDLAATRRELAAELDGAIAKSAEINLHLSSDLRAKEAQMTAPPPRRASRRRARRPGRGERAPDGDARRGRTPRARGGQGGDRRAPRRDCRARRLRPHPRGAGDGAGGEGGAPREQREAHAAKSRELERDAAARRRTRCTATSRRRSPPPRRT